MKFSPRFLILILIVITLIFTGCDRSSGNEQAENGKRTSSEETMEIIFLHHSTGKVIWDAGVKKWFKKYNKDNGTKYNINERAFPAEAPYGWNNYPYDYWNIWIRNAGREKYQNEPTLEILAGKYGLIIFKHCFPVGNIKEDTGTPDIESDEKRIENYKLQYEALREKMHEFPDTKFLVWTGAALVRQATDERRATRAKKFFEWVRDEWNEPGDNIYVWDFFNLETENGLYFKDEYAKSSTNSHPGEEFAKKAAIRFCETIVGVLQNSGGNP